MNDQNYIIQIYPEGRDIESCIACADALVARWNLAMKQSDEPVAMVSEKGIGSLWIKKDPMAKFVSGELMKRANAQSCGTE